MTCKLILRIIWAPALALGLSACNVTKHLDDAKGERLLVKNSIDIQSDKPLSLADRTPLNYELSANYKQPANTRFLGLFYTRLWVYYRYNGRKKGIGKWLMKRMAEPPAIYNPIAASRTATNFANLMRQRGYLKAACSYETDSIGRHKAEVKYKLNLGPLYTISDIRFTGEDSMAMKVLHMTAGESRLRRGFPLDSRLFDAERLRITNELKNRGYAYFTPNFIQFNGDSVGTQTRVDVALLRPGDTTNHKTYTLGNITVFSSLVPDLSSIRKDTLYNGISFFSSEPKFLVKPKYLYRAIALRPSWPYRQLDFDRTQQRLTALGVFKFVSVRPMQDSLNPDQINVAISFSPEDRYAVGGDIAVNYSRNSLSGGLIGVSSSLVAKDRNLFRGAEQLQTNLQYNLEFDVTTRQRLIFSQEAKIQNELALPRFFDYLGFWSTLNAMRFRKKRLLSNRVYYNMRDEGVARLTLNYDYLEQTDFFVYNLLNATFGYQVRANTLYQYTFDHIGIDVLRSKFVPGFQPTEFLERSFDDQLFTGFFMRSFSFNMLTSPNHFGERWQLRFNYELSGMEELLVNRLWAIPFKREEWAVAGLNFAQFLRLDLDAAYTREFRKDLVGGIRVGSGVITPFGDTRTAPYVKQFFVGGPSSIRAWRLRELGPGSYFQAPIANQPFFQAGDFRFEFNAELRFPLFWWFKGAVFVDGGNIWTLQQDNERAGSQLRWDSYKNIALGTGFGVRADFDYFVLRFDWGLKLRRPYINPGDTVGYWVFNRWKDVKIEGSRLRPFNFNLAVGYPF